MKKFFKRRIPNKFTITPINFGLEGIVYPLLLGLNRNSDGLLTNFLFFLGLSVGGKRYIHISTIYPKRGGKILGLRGFHILQLVWCFCYNSFNSWNILVYRIWSYMSELLWNKYNQLSANRTLRLLHLLTLLNECELPVIGSLRLRKDFWDCHGANIACYMKEI